MAAGEEEYAPAPVEQLSIPTPGEGVPSQAVEVVSELDVSIIMPVYNAMPYLPKAIHNG